MSIATWEFESPPLHHQFSFIEKSSVRAQPCLKYEGDNLGKEYFAEIAQLVEHNLAKVGVAGPSPVFRSSLIFYFEKQTDSEVLVNSADEAIAFLSEIDDIAMNPVLEKDIRDYVASDVYYPKRYKIRPRVYFIIIKTEATTMQDFKEKKAVRPSEQGGKTAPVLMSLNEPRYGWYEGAILFKRVQQVPGTGKFQYRDTSFVARVKAASGIDCYNRIVAHLSERVDRRSQFPSAKGKNFKFTFLGRAK